MAVKVPALQSCDIKNVLKYDQNLFYMPSISKNCIACILKSNNNDKLIVNKDFKLKLNIFQHLCDFSKDFSKIYNYRTFNKKCL